MIFIKTQKEIAAMRSGGRILAEIMEKLRQEIAPGKNTQELDELATELVFARGGVPAFKGYGVETGNPYPATICASINSEVVHGIPSSEKILKNGDLLKIDIGMQYQGMFVDMARSFAVGQISASAQKLMEATEAAFWAGLKKMKAGAQLSAYSQAAQKTAEEAGFSVVRNLVGHGVGHKLHEDPYVPNYYNKKYQDLRLEVGMTLALEPMVNAGTFETDLGSDGWVFKTRDGQLSAHYENTILVTEKGTEVLTKI
jgi:methionyl aminopeptidase